MEHPKVIDLDYKERPWDYIAAKYGVTYRRAEVAKGELAYRLVVVREKTGHTSLITQLLDQNGRPIEGIPVTFYWSTAPKPPDPPTTLYPHDWYDRFVWGPTNINGEVGPGMGTGAYHGEGEGGPHKVWIHHPTIKSDIAEKLGMLAGTFHDHCDLVFQLQVSGGAEPGELPDPDDFEIVARLEEEHEAATLGIAYPASVAYDTRGRAGIEGTDEDLETDGPVAFQYDSKDYALVTVCADFDGESSRRFWIEAHDYQSGKTITPRVDEEFAPRPDLRHVIYVVDFKGEEPPPPPPPPPEWSMTTEARPGIALLIGKMPRAGIPVVVTDPRGPKVSVTSGSKPEHGTGGWEVNAWCRGTYTVEFEGQRFQVRVEGQTVIATFEEGEKPVQARLVSTWMGKEVAEAILQALEQQCPGVFSLES